MLTTVPSVTKNNIFTSSKHIKQRSLPAINVKNQLILKRQEVVKVPEFAIKVQENRSTPKIDEITDDSKDETGRIARPQPLGKFETDTSSRSSLKKIDILQTLTVEDPRTKLRAKSVNREKIETDGIQKRDEVQTTNKSRMSGKHSITLSSNHNEENNSNFVSSVKINSNIFRDIFKINHTHKDSVVHNRLLSDKPLNLKIKEARIVDEWREQEERSEPLTPVKFTDSINKQYVSNREKPLLQIKHTAIKEPPRKRKKVKSTTKPNLRMKAKDLSPVISQSKSKLKFQF